MLVRTRRGHENIEGQDNLAENDTNLEVEVKFYLERPETIRQKLQTCATLVAPKAFETNFRYEDKTHSLIREGKLLRLRKDRECRLTFKSRSHEHQRQFKIHHELEVEISDFDTMQAILQQLGFKVAQVYEKQRETFSLRDTLVCLDTMPYGDFLEIEGSENNILKVAGLLGLAWEERILENYLSLFDFLKKKIGLPFKDVTFENFKSHSINMEPFLSLLRAG